MSEENISQQYGGGQEYAYNRTESNRVGITMSLSPEANAVAEVMSGKPGVEVHKFPAMIRIDGDRMLEFDLKDIAEALGVEEDEFGPEDFEVETSTHYGRMVRQDDRVLLFADPGDAAEYLGFNLPKTEQ